jgi:hypothetical protein
MAVKLNSYGILAQNHLRQWRRKLYKQLVEHKALGNYLIAKQTQAENEMESLMAGGYSHDMAWEVVRNRYLTPAPEPEPEPEVQPKTRVDPLIKLACEAQNLNQ